MHPRITRAALLAIVGLLAIGNGMPAPASGPASKPDTLAIGVRNGIARSPNRYLAGVLVRTSKPICASSMGVRRCHATYDVSEVLARQPIGGAAPKTIKMDCSPEAGAVSVKVPERVLVFAVPSSANPEIYTATMLSLLPSAKEIATVRQRLPQLLGS
jgi:hypothetical protein